jgi:hypothetical protein
MNAPKFSKGQQVWEIGNWDSKGTFYYRLVTVQSWGKKQGTVTLDHNGKFSESRVYVECVNRTERLCDHGGVHYSAAVAGFDPEAAAAELATAWIEQEIAQNESLIGHPSRHQPSILQKLEALRAATPAAHHRG